MIKLIAVGKIKEKYINEGINDYLKRISKYTKVKLIETKEYNQKDIVSNLELEADEILSNLNDKDYVIVLDLKGINLSSEKIANKIDSIFNTYSSIVFIIGSSTGIHKNVKDRANYLLSFGNNTFPHQMFRMIVLEQIYRAFKINNNERYHK